MTDLFNSPVLHIEQLSSQLEYRIGGPDDQTVGRATQVAGPKPRKGFVGMFSSGLGGARVVIQVVGLDDVPLFYVDHQDGSPTAVVAPDGTVIGRFVHDRLGESRERAAGGAAGMIGVGLGRRAPTMRYRLEDAADRMICQLTWALRPIGSPEDRRWTPVACDYTDAAGTHIGHTDVREATFKDRYALQLPYRLPEPLRTLVIASPLAFDLTRS